MIDLDNPEQMIMLAQILDERLIDTFTMLFDAESVTDPDSQRELAAWAHRHAYLLGYFHALTEDERGKLCTQLGYPAPRRGER